MSDSSGGNRWLLSFVSLFSALLAFFVLLVVQASSQQDAELDSFTVIQKQLHKQVSEYLEERDISDILLERTQTQGLKLIINTESQFASGSAQPTSELYARLDSLIPLFKTLQPEPFFKRYANEVKTLRSFKQNPSLLIQVEGHTDDQKIMNLYMADNWQLSAARALQVMEYIQQHSQLPLAMFSIAGYANFLPRSSDPMSPQNRRIEIHLDIKLNPVEALNG